MSAAVRSREIPHKSKRKLVAGWNGISRRKLVAGWNDV